MKAESDTGRATGGGYCSLALSPLITRAAGENSRGPTKPEAGRTASTGCSLSGPLDCERVLIAVPSAAISGPMRRFEGRMLTLFLVATRVGRAVAFGLASIADGPSTAFGVSAAAAFAASSLSTIALHPLDTVKTRIQAGTTGSNPLLGDLTQPGVAGLYRGLPMNVLKEAPDAAVFLAVSETLAHSLALQSPWFASHVTLTLLFSGAVGDAVGSLLRLPPEVLCKRLQTSATDACWFDQVAEVDKESWMTAWSAILYRDVPFGGLQIAAFHEARQAYSS